MDLTRKPETHTHTPRGTECSGIVIQEKTLCCYNPIPAANLLLSLSLSVAYFASREHTEGEGELTKKPSRLCQGEMCGHSNTPLPSPAMGDGAGSWERTEENKAKGKGGSNFKRKGKLTLNYCFISGSMKVSDMLHPTPKMPCLPPNSPVRRRKTYRDPARKRSLPKTWIYRGVS